MAVFAFIGIYVVGLLTGYILRMRQKFDPKKLTDHDLWAISKWYRVDLLGAKRRIEAAQELERAKASSRNP